MKYLKNIKQFESYTKVSYVEMCDKMDMFKPIKFSSTLVTSYDHRNLLRPVNKPTAYSYLSSSGSRLNESLVEKLNRFGARQWLKSGYSPLSITSDDIVEIKKILEPYNLGEKLSIIQLKNLNYLSIYISNINLNLFKYDDEWWYISKMGDVGDFEYYKVDSFEGLKEFFNHHLPSGTEGID